MNRIPKAAVRHYYTRNALALGLALMGLTGCGPKWSESEVAGVRTVTNQEGPTLGYSAVSGVKVLTVDRLAFKDLNKNGKLDNYEDWRLSADARAKDLAAQMSVEQIAGLMLYSRHQSIPAATRGNAVATFGGKTFAESGAQPFELSDQQKQFLTEDNLRHVLITTVTSPEAAARWNNNAQALVEALGLGIPVNTSSDPRHVSVATAEYNEGAGGRISMWPSSLGLAATFDPQWVQTFGGIAAKEYRALGIATALSPQVDLATDPRWARFAGTFGEDPQLSTEMARAYIDGFQTSSGAREIADGWGYDSVNAMVKHWPGGGTGEGGRDAHLVAGKYAVYPGNNLQTHLRPFVEGAFKLQGKTAMAAAVMPYYTISWQQDAKNKENVGNSFSSYMITDLLRAQYHYDGVVCTDWRITADLSNSGEPWGVEGLTVAERHYKVLMAGVDQFGGNNEKAPVLEAYAMGVQQHGEQFMRNRFEQSAVRLLKNMFRTGLFENAYLDIEASTATVGKPEFMKAGYAAQLKSIVMLKNQSHVLPLQKGKTVYVPKRFKPAVSGPNGTTPASSDYPANIELVKKYFSVTENAGQADFALVFIQGARSGTGYSADDAKQGGNGYVPISLQYREYTAATARETSIAGGDPAEKFTNRSYKGKKATALNTADLALVQQTTKQMHGKPVIVVVSLENPSVFAEFESQVNSILVTFGVQDQAVLDTLVGVNEPSGLLPLQIPANMQTVESQLEDVPRDMQPHVDTEAHKYDFGFGLNWQGVIKDARTEKYQATS